jgi:putative resolvase
MNLSDWADQVGVSRYAACRWYHAGVLPVPTRRTGRLFLVEPGGPPAEPGRMVICVRVLSAGQRPGLGRQVAGLSAWVTSNGMTVGEDLTEVGSAVNARRGKLGRLLAGLAAARSAIGRRGRLARLGVGHLRALLAAQGRQVMILGLGEVEGDLAGDVTGVLTLLCARLYGRRGARYCALWALGCAQTETPGA